MTMRERFYELATEALRQNERVAVVLADIGAGADPRASAPLQRRHPRAADDRRRSRARARGLPADRALVHAVPDRAPVRADQARPRPPGSRRGARLVRRVVRRVDRGPHAPGARGRRRARALPGWTIEVPGHADESERMLARALENDDRVYIRLTDETNAAPLDGERLTVVRRGSDEARLRARRRADARPGARGDGRPRRDGRVPLARAAVRRRRPTGGGARHGRRARRAVPRRHVGRRGLGGARRTARTGCSRSACRSASSGITARAPSIAPRTGSTRGASARRSNGSSGVSV